MTALKHPVLLWGLPVAVLIIIFWLSLFCYSAIPVSGADAIRALLPGHTPTLPEALVQNLRLPRSLVAVLIGASLALAGTLLQTLTHNPMASPSLLGINSGAALAMALTSALSPTPVAGYSLSFIAACGGGVSWLLVMTAGGGFRHTQDRNKLILAGIALSAFCMALTRITLLLAEDHAYGIFYWLAGGVSPRPLAGCLAALAGGGHCSPCRVAAGESTEPAQRQRQYRPYAGSEPAETTFDHQYVSAASGWRVRQCGRSGGVYRPAGATSGALLGRLRSAQRTAGEHAAGGHADADGRCTARALAFPGDLPAGAVLALIGSPCFVWLVRRRG